ncbi:MAG: PilZ domain-containing protein [Deltaproteobacteria bacterium]
MEKRNFDRIPFQTKAIVRSKDATVIGIVENLSLDGIFLKTPEKLNLNRIVKIEVLITGTSSQLSILLDGKIMRHENVGMAIQFKNVDMDAFFHLKNLISYNTNQLEKLDDEFQRFVKKKGKKKI